MDDAAGAEATLTAALDWWRGSMTAEPAAASAAQLWILRRLVRAFKSCKPLPPGPHDPSALAYFNHACLGACRGDFTEQR